MPLRWLSDSESYRAVADEARAVVRWSRASVVAALAVPLLVLGAIATITRASALEAARERLERAARIGQEHASRVVETNAVVARAVLALAGDADDARLLERQAELHREIVELLRGLPQFQSVWLWDADGHPVAGSLFAQVPRQLDVSDREYFHWAREPRGDAWFVSRPLVSRSTGEQFIDFSRRRTRADGGFGGVLSVSLRPEYFTRFYRELSQREPGLAVALVRADGVVLARWPNPPALDTTLAADSPLRALMAREVAQGETAGRSSIDGRERRVSFRRVEGLPVYVAASLDQASIFADWQRQMKVLAGLALPLSLALAYTSWLAWRRAERERAAVRRFQGEVEQRQRVEETLRQAQKLEALGQITGGVAHDFNNLLMVVNSNAHLLRRLEPALAASAQLAAIERAVAAGGKLTRQLLAFARRQPLQPVSIALDEALPELVDLVRTAVGGAIAVSGDCAADVPAIEADRAELELALLNLAVNARDAMPEGGRLALVARRAAPGEVPGVAADRSFAALSVSDSGTGMTSEVLARVFEPFFTTKETGRGTGLGLAQVWGFATQSGGTARIESAPGQGATVTLYLPAASAAAGARPREQAAPAEIPRIRGRLLLVEDNPQIVEAMAPLLRTLGCEVEHVASGAAALERLARDGGPAVDVVLSDVVMPGPVDGLALALALRERRPQLPVVLMTGYAAQIHRVLAEGFEVVAKPCGPAGLAQALARAMARERRVEVPLRG